MSGRQERGGPSGGGSVTRVFRRLGKDRELMVGLQADFRARLRLNYGKKEAIIKILKEYFPPHPPAP